MALEQNLPPNFPAPPCQPRSRHLAVDCSQGAGLMIESTVANYLASRPLPKRQRQTRRVNANDDLVSAERGGRQAPARVGDYESDLRAAGRIERSARLDDSGEGPIDGPQQKVHYHDGDRTFSQLPSSSVPFADLPRPSMTFAGALRRVRAAARAEGGVPPAAGPGREAPGGPAGPDAGHEARHRREATQEPRTAQVKC